MSIRLSFKIFLPNIYKIDKTYYTLIFMYKILMINDSLVHKLIQEIV